MLQINVELPQRCSSRQVLDDDCCIAAHDDTRRRLYARSFTSEVSQRVCNDTGLAESQTNCSAAAAA